MKALVILIVLGGLGLVALYYFGGFANLDPVAEAEGFRNSLNEGMSWEDVVAKKAPRKFATFSDDPNSMTGTSPDQPFDANLIREAVANRQMPLGFKFDYMFTGDHAWSLHFDGAGRLVAIEPILTTKQLLEGKAFHQ